MLTTVVHAAFGPELRRWRTLRGLSQEKLAEQAEISARHLSFLETGRSAPSRDMVLVLAGALDLPLREQNTLLAAAGYASVFRESPLEGSALGMVRRALDHMLAKHEPYAAVVMNRAWDVSRMNQGAARLFAWALGGRMPPPEVASNAMRALLHPEGLREVVVGWERLAAGLLWRTRREHAAAPDERVERLLAELAAYPGVPSRLGTAADELSGEQPFVTIHLARDGEELRFFTTLTSLGTPLDVTAQEIRIESYFPADDATEAFVRRLAP
jgi:transcriptional regulator with XRE-family HTH domain